MNHTSIVARILECLGKKRIDAVAREFDLAVRARQTIAEQAARLAATGRIRPRALLDRLGREELRAVCRAFDLEADTRSRAELRDRVLDAIGESAPDTLSTARDPHIPSPGDVVALRHRRYLVEHVDAPEGNQRETPGGARLMHRVRGVCLDDDDQGRAIEVIWELELGARILQPHAEGLGEITALDRPRAFGAWLDTLAWSCVTATRADLFQSPFRAGIKLFNHQLTPLQKALELPRANLFIADDVGLGKTIEAGLVIQEMLLRQRVDWILVVCPPSIALQWRDEMQRRFGLRFEIYDRAFVGRRRAERGFSVNPWATHNRFIVSYHTLRRPEHRDPLLAHLGPRMPKSLLVLDEAHTVAPSSSQHYAVDSELTRLARELAPKVENRLFLSATPHNGHSNSFSALLELLDGQRFTRGVPVQQKHLEPVMVRRLKEDLRKLGSDDFPKRRVLEVEVTHRDGRWHQTTREGDDTIESFDLGPAEPFELTLAADLERYVDLMSTHSRRGRLPYVGLQKRLLSSTEAFWRTLDAHEKGLRRAGGLAAVMRDDEAQTTYGFDDDDAEQAAALAFEAESATLPAPIDEARALLDRMARVAGDARYEDDARVRALRGWISRNQCSGVGIEGDAQPDAAWSDRRLIIFTEFGDTLRMLSKHLNRAIAGTERAEDRIETFSGGLDDEQRAEIQRAFSADPADDPVRILICTDAAREGVNLQAGCADLFHFDIPWNPARLEQRNGRIDRTLQPSPEVRCGYFVYADRAEDPVLRTLVNKVDTIQRELGSVGAVLLDRMDKVLEGGITRDTAAALDAASKPGKGADVARAELETQRALQALEKQLNRAGRALQRSRKVIELDPDRLRAVVDEALMRVAQVGLVPTTVRERKGGELAAWTLPPMPPEWAETIDTVRPVRRADESFWDWRKRPPQPVVFHPPNQLTTPVVHLHLHHPLVERLLARFQARGHAAFDLNRVCAARYDQHVAQVVALGRLSLFGPGAARLHDQIIAVGAPWTPGDPGHRVPFDDARDRKVLDVVRARLAHAGVDETLPEGMAARLRDDAAESFSTLWSAVEAEADARGHDAQQLLTERGRVEAEALRDILRSQRADILDQVQQTRFDFMVEDADADTDARRKARRQRTMEIENMQSRLDRIDRELEDEPRRLEELYRVTLRRLTPIGLVYLWPETR